MKPVLRKGSVAMSRPGGRDRLSWEEDSDSRSLIVLIPLFFICAFVIYFLLEITLIRLLEASQWLVLFGAMSFLTLYLLHQRLRLDLTDGLILSIFGLTPLLMAVMLTVNWYFSTPIEESYDIKDIIIESHRVEVILEGGAYDDFYRIRLFDAEELGRSERITFYFGEGALGWKVKREHAWK
jgi:hypothetical protein